MGLQGSFYVSGRDERLPAHIKKILIGASPDKARTAEVISTGWQNNRPFLKCSLAGDRTSAELLTGQAVWASADDISVNDESEYLLSDLRGRVVLDCDGVTLGVIEDIVALPASNNLVVFDAVRNADVDIPMISDYVDMSFQRGGKELRLVVARDVFDEIWNSRDKRK